MIRIGAGINWALRRWWIAPLVILVVAFVLVVGLLELHEECPLELVATVCAFLLGAVVVGIFGPRRRLGRAGRSFRANAGRAPPAGLAFAPCVSPGLVPGTSPLRL